MWPSVFAQPRRGLARAGHFGWPEQASGAVRVLGVEHQIRFCPTSAGRVAYATIGDGPPLVFPAWWVSHQEVLWEDDRYRAFVTALAERHTVIGYDRPGTGLSDRDGSAPLAIEHDVALLDHLLYHVGVQRCTLFGFSAGGAIGGAYAAARPERVQRLIAYGAHASGELIADADARREMVSLVAAHWGVGSRVLAAVFLPDADAQALHWFARYQRASATPEMAARVLEAIYRSDVRESLREVVAPTLVLHRAGDRAVPFEAGREIATIVPGAVFRPLAGDVHPPWRGDTAAVLAAMSDFIRLGAYAATPAASRAAGAALSEREREVLRLVAEGMSNEEIAERLALSPHTVHRHVANVRAKLDQPSRGAAAAAAIRAGLI
jgi:pimeloyl-ACP methyl ester carboxylesterase/DNA-binding CsgD family transcriptional regulator